MHQQVKVVMVAYLCTAKNSNHSVVLMVEMVAEVAMLF
jgi:hypothetical protein